MGRGVSSGGGQSSLGYLFGDGEAPKPAQNNAQAETPVIKTPSKPEPVDAAKQIPAGIHSNSADGQNTGNFITVLFLLFFFCFRPNSDVNVIYFSKCMVT